jgi:4a-hydroxytetrahydrobiopterin dehydratase
MKLSDDKVAAQISEYTGWKVEKNALVKTYTLKSFPDAIAFVTRLAFDAEAADHHPDLHVNYKKVTVTWSTHSAGGVTEKDFAGVKQSEMIAARSTT